MEQQTKLIFSKQVASNQQPVKKQSIIKNSVVQNKNAQIGLMPNHSPIKTRLNVRQSLLHSLKSQQQNEQKISKQNESKNNNNKSNDDNYSHQRDKSISNEPLVKKQRKIKTSESNEIERSFIIKTNSKQDSSVSLSTSFTHQLSSGVNRATDNKNSYISNANISSIINNTTSNHLNKINSNDVNLSSQQITSNPLYWTTAEVCKYLLDNKFDPNLTNLIKEHVI